MLNCRQVTRLVSRSMDSKLPWYQRLGVRIHLWYCVWCRRYAEQVRFLRRASHDLAGELDAAPEGALSPEAKDQMRERLRQAIKENPPATQK